MNQSLGIGVLIAIGVATFLLGGAAPGATPFLVATVAAAAAIHLARRPHGAEPPARRLAVVAALASVPLLVGALELVPIPRGAVSALAPATARLYDRDDDAASSAPRARPLSVETGTSRRALERGIALVALFVLAARLARRRADARTLALWLLGVGAAVAGCGLGLSDTKQWADEIFRDRAHAPFKNPNHFATFIEVLLPLALGVALGIREPDPGKRPVPPTLGRIMDRPDLLARIFATVCCAGFVAAILRSQSRAAVLAVGAGSLVAIGGARALSKGRLAAATALFAAVALGITWANERTPFERLKTTSEVRDSLAMRAEYWKLGLRVLEGRALTGSGLGTYDATSFARLTSETATVLFLRPERAHNDYVNLASDLGVPAALAGVAAVAVALATIASRLGRLASEPRGFAAGAMGGATAALVHAFFDFGLELAPVGALFAFVLGVGWGASETASEPAAGGAPAAAPSKGGPLRRIAAGLLAALSIVSLVDLAAELAAAGAGTDLEKIATARRLAPDDAQLAALEAHALRAKKLPGAVDAGRAAVRFAPGSARAQGELALALLDGPDLPAERRTEGERRLALALELGPSWGALHFAAGCYWLERTAATNDRAAAARAVHELREASRFQLAEQPGFRDAARARIEALLREGKLGALGEAMLRDLAAP